MTVNYTKEPTRTWGTITAGAFKIEGRLLAVSVGFGFWILATVSQTGGHALIALWANLTLLAGLLVISSGTRTVPLRKLTAAFCYGGAMVGVVLLVGGMLIWMFGWTGGFGRGVYIPILEEVAKLLPVSFLIWRAGRLWRTTFGITDILLLGAASGAGFSWVEDAFIRAHSGWPEELPGLPVTEIIGGHLIVGHAIWTAVAASTIGLALIMRRREIMLPVACIGLALSTMDHVVNNLQSSVSSSIYPIFSAFTGNGYFSMLAFAAVVIGANLYDCLLIRRLPKYPEFGVPSRFSNQRPARWSFLADRRMLAYAQKRFNDRAWMKRAECALMVAVLTKCLIDAHQQREPAATQNAD